MNIEYQAPTRRPAVARHTHTQVGLLKLAQKQTPNIEYQAQDSSKNNKRKTKHNENNNDNTNNKSNNNNNNTNTYNTDNGIDNNKQQQQQRRRRQQQQTTTATTTCGNATCQESTINRVSKLAKQNSKRVRNQHVNQPSK